ncbi:LysR family nitrogen assimilation transcriptional regulator [Neorhizobium galegae]|uniref:LysR family transcriptional regulator n=1 Tax=Neorhizobium galegae TaxID=399 RepID=UPI0027801130|nr:LysR family transcriptional regulator [Neorhizobium galegae]MDQ0137774.1 LysR family nitrogen assimilation transcriptional regulator [Neorhizobium galegae]
MDLKDLQLFIRLVKYPSLSEASERLYIAQSALSRRLLRLEHQLGVSLLIRSARGIELTPEGEHLAKKAQGIFDQIHALQNEIVTMSSRPSGVVKLGFTPSVARTFGPKLAATIASSCPEINLILHEYHNDKVVDELQQGNLDLACFYSERRETELDANVLLREPLYLIGSLKSFRSAGLSTDVARVEALMDLPLIIPEDRSINRIIGQLLSQRKTLAHAVPGSTVHTVKGLIADDKGFAIWPYVVVQDEVMDGRLLMANIEPSIVWLLQVGCAPRRPLSPAAAVTKKVISSSVDVLLQSGQWRGERG